MARGQPTLTAGTCACSAIQAELLRLTVAALLLAHSVNYVELKESADHGAGGPARQVPVVRRLVSQVTVMPLGSARNRRDLPASGGHVSRVSIPGWPGVVSQC
jgi:hypothetical protein